MTIFALLEMHKKGEATWSQRQTFGPIEIVAGRAQHGEASCRVSSAADLARTIEALLFLSPEPVGRRGADRGLRGAARYRSATRSTCSRRSWHRAGAGSSSRRSAGGFTLATDPAAEAAARRLLSRPKTPPLTQAQAETLAIVAYLQPVSRPEIARIRGVSSESAVQTLSERGLIEESGRSRFGATIFRTTELFERLFGLRASTRLPDVARFDPTPEDAAELRERLLKAGEQRSGG